MRAKGILTSVLLGADLIVGGPAWAAPDPRGVWIDDKGRGGVEIKECGANLCGHIVWARDGADSSKGCGKQIIGDVEPQGSGLWDNGWIYDPDTRKKYDVELKLLDDNRLLVKGYAGVKFFSRSMVWTRAPADIKRCNAVETKTVDPVRPGEPANNALVGPNSPTKEAASKSAEVQAPVEPAPSVPPSPEVKSTHPADQSRSNEATAPARPDVPNVATEHEPNDYEGRPKVRALLSKLRDLKFGDGYGVRATGTGNCLLKVPHFSMSFKCTD
jgi:uncharacterized protein (DUF2147 family)